MPLPPLLASNTRRWWMVYTVNGATHRMLCRTADSVDATGANGAFQQILNQLANSTNAIRPQNLEVSEKGSDVRNIATWTGAPVYGLGDDTVDDRRARSISFVGRTQQGYKTRFFIFGPKDISEPDYRVDISEGTIVAAIVNVLNGAVNVFLGVDGGKSTWKGYANISFSQHWIKEFRKAGG